MTFFQLIFYLLLVAVFCESSMSKNTLRKEKLKAYKFPPCQACKILAKSFQKQVEQSAHGKFEGALEEAKQGTYVNSEMQLIEILKKICSDVEEGKGQCQFLAEENERILEDWFFYKRQEAPNIVNYLCVEVLKLCCPLDTYGADCMPCPGFPDSVCNKCGKCQGAGTRKGSEKCVCESGYTGNFCESCAQNYFEAYRDKEKLLCSQCHSSCDRGCTQAGRKGCITCKPGWVITKERGCEDVNECLGETFCKNNQFCVNNEGSYSCLDCDKSCASCYGAGPDMCEKCAKGFKHTDNLCVDEKLLSYDTHMNLTRYLTYVGLCIATCIIFQKNHLVASAIGLCVAVYISVSEYMLRGTSSFSALSGLDFDEAIVT